MSVIEFSPIPSFHTHRGVGGGGGAREGEGRGGCLGRSKRKRVMACLLHHQSPIVLLARSFSCDYYPSSNSLADMALSPCNTGVNPAVIKNNSRSQFDQNNTERKS